MKLFIILIALLYTTLLDPDKLAEVWVWKNGSR